MTSQCLGGMLGQKCYLFNESKMQSSAASQIMLLLKNSPKCTPSQGLLATCMCVQRSGEKYCSSPVVLEISLNFRIAMNTP